MATFQITFFRTLEKAGIEPDEAQRLAELAEDYIVRTVDTANKDLVAKLDTMNKNIDTKVTISRFHLTIVVMAATIGGAFGPALLKAIGLP